MISLRRILFVGSTAVLLVVARLAGAAELALRYEIKAGGFSIGAADVRVHLADGRYRVHSHFVAQGLAEFFTGFVSQSASEGRVGVGGPSPEAHRADNIWRGAERRVRAVYPVVGAPRFEAVPDAVADGRKAVPTALTIGSVDPLSAGLALSLAAAGTPGPGKPLAVYDGRRRYDVTVISTQADVIRETMHAGPVVRMRVGWKSVAGEARRPFFAHSDPAKQATVWFRPPTADSLGLPLPLRAEIESPFGTAVARLVGFRLLP